MTRLSTIKSQVVKMENRLFDEIKSLGYTNKAILNNVDVTVSVILPEMSSDFVCLYWQYQSAKHYAENYDFYKAEEKAANEIYYPYK